MKRLVRIVYPWDTLQRGQAFFVPALDTERVMREGLRKGFHPKRPPPKAVVGCYDGCWGVLFFRAGR